MTNPKAVDEALAWADSIAHGPCYSSGTGHSEAGILAAALRECRAELARFKCEAKDYEYQYAFVQGWKAGRNSEERTPPYARGKLNSSWLDGFDCAKVGDTSRAEKAEAALSEAVERTLASVEAWSMSYQRGIQPPSTSYDEGRDKILRQLVDLCRAKAAEARGWERSFTDGKSYRSRGGGG